MRPLAIGSLLWLGMLLGTVQGCASGEEPGDEISDPPGSFELPEPAGVPAEERPCITAFACEARTAEGECGESSATGRRGPDRGAPFCTDKRLRHTCSCDVLRCQGLAPLCPGTYRVTFRERLIAGCDGVPGQLGGNCPAAWNVVELMPQALVLAERTLHSMQLGWDFAEYSQDLTLTGTAPVRLVVEQYCWFPDVSGAGGAGRIEVSHARIARH